MTPKTITLPPDEYDWTLMHVDVLRRAALAIDRPKPDPRNPPNPFVRGEK